MMNLSSFCAHWPHRTFKCVSKIDEWTEKNEELLGLKWKKTRFSSNAVDQMAEGFKIKNSDFLDVFLLFTKGALVYVWWLCINTKLDHKTKRIARNSSSTNRKRVHNLWRPSSEYVVCCVRASVCVKCVKCATQLQLRFSHINRKWL